MITEEFRPKELNEHYFGVQLNFYDKDLDVTKKNILHFWCLEDARDDENLVKKKRQDDEEEKKGDDEEVKEESNMKITNILREVQKSIEEILASKKGMRPMEFSVI